MKSIELTEHSTKTVTLTPAEYEVLQALNCVGIASRSAGRYQLAAKSKVGAVQLGGRQLVIRPKVTELNNILFLIGYATGRERWREDFVQLDVAAGLHVAVAESFVRVTSRALRYGPLRRYRRESVVSANVRGRIDIPRQLSRYHGVAIPLVSEHDEITVDIPENRILLAATRALLGLPDLPGGTFHRLRRIAGTLEDVRPLSLRDERPSVVPDRRNRIYRDALRLANVILDGSSFDLREGSLTVSGFLLDMWRIYEDFVTGALSDAVTSHGAYAKAQDKHFLTTAATIHLRPDLVCYDGAGAAVAVVDAKYKIEQETKKARKFPEADLYQMLAYCNVLGLSEGHLVYAKGQEPRRTHHIRTCGITIHCHTLDLALDPDAMLQHIDALARTILRIR